jgi:hypothetical protein
MKVYSDKYSKLSNVYSYYEYEVLNELKDLDARTDSNCLYHTRFLFEMDEMPLKEQCDFVQTVKDKLVRITYSGSKSLHCIVEFDPKYEKECRWNYKQIWNYINETYFNGACDNKCVNPARLTINPGVIRNDTGKLQALLYNNPHKYFPVPWEEIAQGIEKARQIEQMHKQIENSLKRKVTEFSQMGDDDPNGRMENNEKVKYYLQTSFPNSCGNGNSNASLFTAMCICDKAGDKQTLEKVLDKARNEGWSDREIEQKFKYIRR